MTAKAPRMTLEHAWPLPPQLSAELRTVIAACIWPQTPDSVARLRAAAAEVSDWPQLLRIAQRHRVVGLLQRNLHDAGITPSAACAGELATAAAQQARQNLRYAAEALRLQEALSQRGISVLFVKGASLAKLAYSDLSLRHSKDIDLVVRPAEVQAAQSVILAAAYRRVRPGAAFDEPTRWQQHLKRYKECEFIHTTLGIQVELHWRLTDNPHLSPPLPAPTDAQRVMLSTAGALNTFPPDALFVYLCVHGAQHAWMRLKWLADIAALCAAANPDDLRRRYILAQTWGVERCVAQALGLCQRLFGTRLPEELAESWARDYVLRALQTLALLTLLRGDGSSEIVDQRFGTSIVTASEFLLTDRWRTRLRTLQHVFEHHGDVEQLPLPPALSFLYPAIRLPLWAWRRVRHGGRSR